MARKDTFEHAIFSTIDNFLDLRKNKTFIETDRALTDDQRRTKDHAFAVVQDIKVRIGSLPNDLLNDQNLEAVNAPLQSAFNELSAFLSNKNPSHIQNAGPYLSQALVNSSWAIPTSADTKKNKVVENELKSISVAAGAAFAELTAQRTQLLTEFAALSTKLNAQDAKLNELSQTFDQKTAEANATSAEISTQYSKLEQKFQQDFGGQQDKFEETYSEFETASTKAAADLITKLSQHEDNARKIVQVVGNVGVTGNYSNRATLESGEANLWRYITVGFFGLGVAVIAGNLGVHI